MNNTKISFIIPSRNNLKYLQQCVNSIIKCYGNKHDIVLLDDASDDGTLEWIQSLESNNFIKYRNDGPERLGHTILYDKGVELSNTDVFTIFHADMICTKNYVENLLKNLKEKCVVSATRIEPPLHPPGPEKFVKMFGFEPEEFKTIEFENFVSEKEIEFKNQTTNGIFAPWCMYKKDFQAIGGHDELFAPMELEDSDIFNRMYLAGYTLIQSRDAFVYHMTCRGSRFKNGLEIEAEIPMPDGTIWYKPKDSEEYKLLRQIKFKEWWRKWHQNVLHDTDMRPIVNNVYNIGLVVKNCTINILTALEPWCDNIYIEDMNLANEYILREQPNTKFILNNRVKNINNISENDVLIEFDGKLFGQSQFDFIQNLSEVLKDSAEVGIMEYDIFKLTINSLDTYEKTLINCKTNII